MFVIDDFLLAVFITFIILLATIITIPVFVIGVSYMGMLLCGGKESETNFSTFGGAKKITKAITKLTKNIKIMLISFDHKNVIIDPIKDLVNTYGQAKTPKEIVDLQKKYIDMAKNIYKQEKKDLSIFDINYVSILDTYTNNKKITNKLLTTMEIKKLLKTRLLTDAYPEIQTSSHSRFGITNIEYTPYNRSEFVKKMDTVYKYAIINSLRELKDKEKEELSVIVNEFNSGKLTEPLFKINFLHYPSIRTSSCYGNFIKYPYSPTYKKLHWGQRKLLLTEIDFFTRCAHHMGKETFKNQNISVVYPGSAHGDKLMMQMEMFPNVIYYLWDPARFNIILYIADFLRRKLPIEFSHTPEQLAVGKKFVGRVFINMEMPNDIYKIYHHNSTNDNIPANYGPEYGFFVQKSADYYLKYKKDMGDTSPTLYVSDIRMFTNTMAYDLLLNNSIKGYNDILALRVSSEISKHLDYKRDMQLQYDWFDMVNATYGLFKFKLKSKTFSKFDAQYKYLNGDIVLQAWAPIASSETRLYVSPAHKAHKDAYYNVKAYTNKCKVFNSIMRVHNANNVKLSNVNIHVSNGEYTIGDIWKPFLSYELIGMDAVIEACILYDYLLIYKDKKDIKHTDIMLAISDLTQSLLDKSNYNNILSYFKKDNDAENILNSRTKYHKSFIHRLDYNTKFADFRLCKIKRGHGKHFHHSNTVRN
jgi:hypothetical protein